MPGVPGSGGPPPKRDSQRRRSAAPAKGKAEKVPTGEVEVPDADESWHPIALNWYRSLGKSGQSAFYVTSDWCAAYAVAEAMSREFKPQPLVVGSGKSAEVQMVELPPKAASLQAWAKVWTGLMVMEGDRRRLRLELERPKPDGEADGDVEWIDDARRRLRESG